MLIAQLSDLHVTLPGASPGAGVDSAANLARVVAQLEAMNPRPDGVVLSGDLVDRGDAAEYARLASLLAPLSMPCWLMAGNHDDRTELRRAFPQLPRLPGKHAYLQYAVELPGLRLLLLDSVVPGSAAGELCAQRLAWLEAELAGAPEQPVIVFIHHPPYATGSPLLDSVGLANGDDLGAIIDRYDRVLLVSAGHVHRVTHCLWHETIAMTAPSTAHQFVLELAPDASISAVAEPPGFLLHRFDGQSLVSFSVPIV
jgi:3',5'-cyclic AMP phosphodiesterase CpdA